MLRSAYVDVRRNLRRARRQRKTPYRMMRKNRASLRKENRIPPSTKSRWDAKLNMIKQLSNIIPITVINIEDINAITKKGQKNWNKSFAFQCGKKYFDTEVSKYNIPIIKTQGYDTAARRKTRHFKKLTGKDKMSFLWESHNVDAHSLCEIALKNANIKPHKGLYKIEYFRFYRRMLHRQNPQKGNVRTDYGSTITLGMSRGAIVRHIKYGICALGGSSIGRASLHNRLCFNNRLCQNAKKEDITLLYNSKQLTNYIKQ